MDYKEQLRNPKWQKKRLEIMNRDNFKCRNCEDDNEAEFAWDYPNEYLITLCNDCHHEEHIWNQKEVGEKIIKKIISLSNKPLSLYDIEAHIYLVTENGLSIKEATKQVLLTYIKDL